MPGESLDGLTLLAVSAEYEPGTVDFAIPLSGLSIPSDGYFLASEISYITRLYNFLYPNEPSSVDIETGVRFWGSPNTFLLVSDFTGTEGFDYDIENDGIFDSTPWTYVVDAVSFSDGNNGVPVDIERTKFYGGQVVSGRGVPGFQPAHIERVPNLTGDFVTARFGDPYTEIRYDTPGFANIIVPEPTTFLLTIFGILPLLKRR